MLRLRIFTDALKGIKAQYTQPLNGSVNLILDMSNSPVSPQLNAHISSEQTRQFKLSLMRFV